MGLTNIYKGYYAHPRYLAASAVRLRPTIYAAKRRSIFLFGDLS